MRLLLWLGAAAALGFGLLPRSQGEEWVVIVGGSLEGYLSPCGCTKPMSGGIRRRATAYRQETKNTNSLILELGPVTGGLTRQHEIKAETSAQFFEAAGVDAVSLSAHDARLGAGVASSISRLSGGRLLATGLPNALEGEVRESLSKGPFVVGSWDEALPEVGRALGGQPRALKEALGSLCDQAEVEGKSAVLLLEGNRAAALGAAAMEPRLSLILYRSASQPPLSFERRGRTLLATPGPKGKAFLRITWKGGAFSAMRVVDLGPSTNDDPTVQKIYREYQQRVKSEKLLEMQPRSPSEAFAGSQACLGCHDSAAKAWLNSSHAKALKTLEEDGHDRDPDCVSCHVVHLDKETGFQSREKTPDMADVGCESCHGPGKAHTMQPYVHKMPQSGEKSCQPCHVADHSPSFDFAKYWARIAH
jgi:hypothetical protein